ncbi:MAG: YigZ family protein [Firmicutes bacterium]|nr:YigZ family protein [Bacillota bacterium]
MEITEYKTVAKPATVEIKIEKSIFIGHTQEVETSAEAQEFIAKIRAEHNQATHNCYAYRVGWGKTEEVHFHDHGEPSGTAGKPILGAIQRLDLTNTVVVVTRYFGGKKLGVRGLIEAYGETATKVLEEAGIKIKPITESYLLEVEYPNLNSVQYYLEQAGGQITHQDFGATVHLTVALPVNTSQATVSALKDKLLVRKIKEAQ